MTTPTIPGSEAAERPVWDPSVVGDAAETADTPGDAAADAATDATSKPVARTPIKAAPRRTNSVSVLLAISTLIAIGGITFAIGRATTAGTTTTTSQNGAPAGQFAPDASGQIGGFSDGQRLGDRAATLSGTVVSVSADSITLELADGSTVTVATGSSTTYHSQTSGSSADLAAGQTVQIATAGGANQIPGASPAAGTARTATDVTITAK
jgi:hypothetical protein